MNSSTKMTALSLLAAGAVGLLAFVGCTTDSSLDNDVDGGNPDVDDNDGGTEPTEEDAGDSGTTPFVVGSVCKTTYQESSLPYQDPADTTKDCQRCLETSCCADLRACYNAAPTAGSDPPFTCEEYAKCISECQEDPDPDACNELCDTAATEDIRNGYSLIVLCVDTGACATACATQ